MLVDRMVWFFFFSSGLGDGRRGGGGCSFFLFFLAIYGEGPFHSRMEACILEGATVLGAVFHGPFKLIWTIILFLII